MSLVALDDFAGTGWGVACHRLGILEAGVEKMPEAVATRAANGMHTIGLDVWDHIDKQRRAANESYQYDLYIASPPCQTFSLAGGGSGRKALDEVIDLIDSKAYLDVDLLHEFGERHDPRTALVLVPLVRIVADVPTYVVLEQVPPVLPVWERMAEELRKWGYSTWTGILNAEQYGVPQTRRRAVLIARADGIEAAPPTPTHNKYNHRQSDGGRNFDSTLEPWVSMSEALGWGLTERPFFTVSGGANDGSPGGHTGGQDPMMIGGSGARKALAEARATRRFAGAGAAAERTAGQIPCESGEPAHTVTGKGNAVWVNRPATTVSGDPRIAAPGHHDRQMNGAERVTIEEASALQSYPPGFKWAGKQGKQFLQVGNAVPPLLAEAILKGFLS